MEIPGLDKSRAELLQLIDWPWLDPAHTGAITRMETAEAMYLLACGPDALKPLLDGQRAEFTVRALNFLEHHGRGCSVQEVGLALVQAVDEALGQVGEQEPDEPGDNGKTNEELLAGMDSEKIEQLQELHRENVTRLKAGGDELPLPPGATKPTVKENTEDG